MAILSCISIIISVIAIIVKVILDYRNHKYVEKVALNELRNKRLKYHYDEIVKEMNEPYLSYNPSLSYNPLGNFNLKFLTIVDNNTYEVKVSEDYGRHFITDKNLYRHLEDGYSLTFNKLKDATNIDDIKNYVKNLNDFISDIKEKVEKKIKKFSPKIEYTNNYTPNKCGYILSNLISIIITQIDSESNNYDISKFIKNELNNSMLKIECCGYTAITVSTNLSELDKFIEQLNNIYKDFIERGKELCKQNKKISNKWNNFMKDLKEIQNDYYKSGVPLKGTCDVCKKTKEANNLIHHS